MDELVLTMAAPATFYQAFLQCGSQHGISEADARAALIESRRAISWSKDGLTTGLVEMEMANSETTSIEADNEASLLFSLPVVVDGADYPNCEAFAMNRASESVPERLRGQVALLYQSELAEPLRQDARWKAIDSEWSACMHDAGYPGLERPGDEVSLVSDRLSTVPKADVAELEAVLQYDREVVSSSLMCREAVDLARLRNELRMEFDMRFWAAHEELLLRLLESREPDLLGSETSE